MELCLQNSLEVKATKIVIFDREGKNERTDANIANKVEKNKITMDCLDAK